ncbi:hypothetical protein HK096_005651 [Nowakowskiella sp. JEL0078]|nr:hypothetical protein HK096_005651 [Nowakowskiella sp. JEL0078]
MANFSTNFLALIGALTLTRLLVSLTNQIYATFLRPSLRLTKYGAKNNTWAVVTGASDGIGLEFAKQLAHAGFHVVLIARTASKLETVASQISAENPSVQTLVIPFDFASAQDTDYKKLAARLTDLRIGVLSLEPEFIESMVNINVRAQLRVTSIVLPQMLEHKQGLILNLGSAAGFMPSGLLAVYSASKAFLSTWSQALASEVKDRGVHVELVNTYFVTTKMSKIRKPSLTTPTPKKYVQVALQRAGSSAFETPFWSHALIHWVLDELVPRSTQVAGSYAMHLGIRRQALKKQERERAKAN